MTTTRKRGRPASGKEKLLSVSVQLHPTELAKLKKIADDDERSISFVIRLAVRQMLKQDTP